MYRFSCVSWGRIVSRSVNVWVESLFPTQICIMSEPSLPPTPTLPAKLEGTSICARLETPVVKNPSAHAGDLGDLSSIPGLGRPPGGGHGNPLQYSCLRNPVVRGTWWAIAHGVTKSQTKLKWLPTAHSPCTSGMPRLLDYHTEKLHRWFDFFPLLLLPLLPLLLLFLILLLFFPVSRQPDIYIYIYII